MCICLKWVSYFLSVAGLDWLETEPCSSRIDSNGFRYLDSCISLDSLIFNKCPLACKGLVFTSWRHLWNRRGIWLLIRGRVCTATLRSPLLYRFETWPFRGQNFLEDCRCLISLLLLAENSERILSVNRNVGVSCWAIRESHWMRIGWGGWITIPVLISIAVRRGS